MDNRGIGCGKTIEVGNAAIIVQEFNVVICPRCNDSIDVLKDAGLTYYVYQKVTALENVRCGQKLHKTEAENG